MLIEKKYHTEAAREMDEIIREEEERKASLSEEERTAEKEEKYAETEEIIRKVQEAERQNFHIVSKEKIKRFSYLAMDALRMAETLLLDVTVRTDGTIGRIRLSTDFFVLTINEQISNFAQTYPTNLKASSNEALLFMRRYRFANCSCFSCCFKDAYPSSNVQ